MLLSYQDKRDAVNELRNKNEQIVISYSQIREFRISISIFILLVLRPLLLRNRNFSSRSMF